jgi:hypothetical protein
MHPLGRQKIRAVCLTCMSGLLCLSSHKHSIKLGVKIPS